MKIKLAICVIVKNEAPYMKEWIFSYLSLISAFKGFSFA